MSAQWSTGFCSCCDDSETCCTVWNVPHFAVATTTARLRRNKGQDESWLGFCILAACFPPCMAAMTRCQVRQEYGIEGNGCVDCLAGFYCMCCSNAQILKQTQVSPQGVAMK